MGRAGVDALKAGVAPDAVWLGRVDWDGSLATVLRASDGTAECVQPVEEALA
jgi:hypothetical protein